MVAKSKLKKLKRLLSSLDSAVIAYSGGIDSTFLLKVASEVLPERIIAVTAISDTYNPSELRQARGFARKLSVRHLTIKGRELKSQKFTANSPLRCYYCKKELFSRLRKIAKKFELNAVLDATNFDDIRDYRPGMQAAEELKIISPLKAVKFCKREIRALAKSLDLPNWNKPENACLASRVGYGTKITSRRLKMIREAEEFLKGLGFKKIRVRLQDQNARIEVPGSKIKRFLSPNLTKRIVSKLKKIGFTYISLDLQGYRQGSMNEALNARKRG